MADWDSHHYCPSCRDKGKGDDVCVVEKQEDCYICLQFTPEQVKKLKAKKVQRKIKEGSISKGLEDSLLGVDSSNSSQPLVLQLIRLFVWFHLHLLMRCSLYWLSWTICRVGYLL